MNRNDGVGEWNESIRNNESDPDLIRAEKQSGIFLIFLLRPDRASCRLLVVIENMISFDELKTADLFGIGPPYGELDPACQVAS